MLDWLSHLNPVWPVVAGLAVLVGLIRALDDLYHRYRRSRLIKPVDLGLPRVPKSAAIYGEFADAEHWVQGRQDDIGRLRTGIEGNQLVFVHGPSGVGKSTLLKLGVSRDLYYSGRWLPVYVDSWGDDWVLGPWNNLASYVQLA